MSVDADNFLYAAEQLFANASHEIDYRNAISRAYYATFHASTPISNHLPRAENYKPKGSHDKEISKLTRCSSSHPQVIVIKAIGYDIQKRKVQRVAADYRIDATLEKSDAEEQLLKEKCLLEQIDALKAALQLP